MQLLQLMLTWQLGSIPTTTQCLNQCDAGNQATFLNLESILLVGQ